MFIRGAIRLQTWLQVSLAQQRLSLVRADSVVQSWPISSARAGAGEGMGSGCTPRGWHRIRALIGHGMPLNSVFVARRPTGEIYDSVLAAAHPERDWILTRILWLTGTVPGVNRGGGVDTLRRFIYIHGTPDTEAMGLPRSHGCIRMRNRDILQLFDQCHPGMSVLITEDETCSAP